MIIIHYKEVALNFKLTCCFHLFNTVFVCFKAWIYQVVLYWCFTLYIFPKKTHRHIVKILQSRLGQMFQNLPLYSSKLPWTSYWKKNYSNFIIKESNLDLVCWVSFDMATNAVSTIEIMRCMACSPRMS